MASAIAKWWNDKFDNVSWNPSQSFHPSRVAGGGGWGVRLAVEPERHSPTTRARGVHSSSAVFQSSYNQGVHRGGGEGELHVLTSPLDGTIVFGTLPSYSPMAVVHATLY